MRLHLIRHGQTDWNIGNRLQGGADIDLNDTGKQQAVAVAVHLKDKKEHFDYLIVSPLSRAIQTANPITEAVRVNNKIIEPLIRERSFGSMEGSSSSTYTSAAESHPQGLHKFRPENGESMEDVHGRATEFLGTIFRFQHNSNICIVSHGVFLGTLIRTIVRAPDVFDYENYWVDNGSISVINLEPNGEFSLDQHNFKP